MSTDNPERPDDFDEATPNITPDEQRPSAAASSGDDFWNVRRDDEAPAYDDQTAFDDALNAEPESADVLDIDEPVADPFATNEPPAQPSYGATPDGYGAQQSDDDAPAGGDPYGPRGNYGQTPYGSDPYGQNTYGQAPYGEAPAADYGQATYGPPSGSYGSDQFAGGPLNTGANYGGAFSGPPQDGYPPQDGSYGAYGQAPYSQAPYGQDPYGQNPYGPVLVYASWGKRLKAALLDIILPFIVLGAIITPVTQGTDPTQIETTTTFFQSLVQWTLLGVLWGFMSGNTGQTPGRKWAKTQLVGENGQPIGTGRTIAHYALHVIDGTLCGLGFLWPLWDAKRQTFSDKILKTYVIDLEPQVNPYDPAYGQYPQQPYPPQGYPQQ